MNSQIKAKNDAQDSAITANGTAITNNTTNITTNTSNISTNTSNLYKEVIYTASDTTLVANDTQISFTNDTTLSERKAIRLYKSGIFRVTFDHSRTT